MVSHSIRPLCFSHLLKFDFHNDRMAMVSEVQSQVSKHNTVVIAGNLGVTDNAGAGAATALLRHQVSPVASIEFMATAGLRSLITIQTSR